MFWFDFNCSNDPYEALNWPFRKEAATTFLYGLTTCWITFASAVYSAGFRQIPDEFHVATEVAAAGVSLMVFGFSLGSVIWQPLSEVYGRKWVIIVVCFSYNWHPPCQLMLLTEYQPYFIAAVFSFGTATAKDIQTILITRFFSGFFGGVPLQILEVLC